MLITNKWVRRWHNGFVVVRIMHKIFFLIRARNLQIMRIVFVISADTFMLIFLPKNYQL